jgi:hypothetical protein
MLLLNKYLINFQEKLFKVNAIPEKFMMVVIGRPPDNISLTFATGFYSSRKNNTIQTT